MRSVAKHRRAIPGLFVLIFFARTTLIHGSSISPISPSQTQSNNQRSRKIDSEVAYWSAQLKSTDEEQRREAAMGLSQLESSAVTPVLASALTDSSPRVRAAAVAGLGERGEVGTVPLLVPRLAQDRDAFVRKTAAYALGRFNGTERTAALTAALKDKDPEVRGAAAVALADHVDANAVEALITALSDKSVFVRAQAARALGVNGNAAAQAVPRLITLLTSDEDSEVKRQAATALGEMGARLALTALERATHNSDPYLAQSARDAITAIEGKK